KIGTERRFQGLLAEALRGQKSGRGGTSTAPAGDLASSIDLRLEAGERLDVELARDSSQLEVGDDRCIAVAAPGQCRGPRRREPQVVHHTHSLEPRDCLLARLRGD